MIMEDYNIYLLFKQRDECVIRKSFEGLDVKSMNDELMVYKNCDFDDVTKSEPDWVGVSTFKDVVRYGMNSNEIYTSAYFQVTDSIFSTVILTFTVDGGLVVGFSLSSDNANDDTYKSYTKKLMENLKPDALSVFIEVTPPFSEHDFLNQTKKHAVFSLPEMTEK